MAETWGRVKSSTVWPSLLLSKHSAESPQHSGKKNTNTHACTWSIEWKVLVFPSLEWLSNQALGLRAVLQVCILTDKTEIFSYDALTSWFTSVVDLSSFFQLFPKSLSLNNRILPSATAEGRLNLRRACSITEKKSQEFCLVYKWNEVKQKLSICVS